MAAAMDLSLRRGFSFAIQVYTNDSDLPLCTIRLVSGKIVPAALSAALLLRISEPQAKSEGQITHTMTCAHDAKMKTPTYAAEPLIIRTSHYRYTRRCFGAIMWCSLRLGLTDRKG